MGACSSRQDKQPVPKPAPKPVPKPAPKPAPPLESHVEISPQKECFDDDVAQKTITQPLHVYPQIGVIPEQQQQYTLVTDGKSVSCSAGVTQITVEIGGERFLVYLDSSKHKLLYNPIVYSTLEGVNSNFTTAFVRIPSVNNSFLLKSFVTPIASPTLTQVIEDTYDITMEITNDSPPLYVEQQRSGLSYALYFSHDPSVERFYIQPRLTNKPNPRRRTLQAVRKARAETNDFIFDFISERVNSLTSET